MAGTFSGRVAFCTIEIDAAVGAAVITNQSGEFDEAPAPPLSPIYSAAGIYELSIKPGLGIDPAEGVYLVSAGQGTSVAGTPIVFAAADQTITIHYLDAAGANADPSVATSSLHLSVLVRPSN